MSIRSDSPGHVLRAGWRKLRSWIDGFASTVRGGWQSWSLSRQFLTCASVVLVPAMWVMGIWVADRIEDSATSRAGTSAALYMENFIEPLVQDLVGDLQLSEASREKIGRLLQDTTIGQRVHTLKIWTKGPLVAASNRPELVGRRFPPSAGLRRAWSGLVTATFDNLHDDENRAEQKSGMPLLEVYIPIRERGSERILCVAEFYEVANDLKIELTRARRLSWLVVSAVTLSMLAALLAIVRRGSSTIEVQQASLEKQVAELTHLLSENRHLRARAHRASARSSESNEGKRLMNDF